MIKLSLSINEVSEVTGLGRTKIYENIGSGALKARKFGKRTIILKDDLDAFLSNLENYPSKRQGA